MQIEFTVNIDFGFGWCFRWSLLKPAGTFQIAQKLQFPLGVEPLAHLRKADRLTTTPYGQIHHFVIEVFKIGCS